MKKILITGISGFIGFHLARFLKKQNHFVIGIDNFNSYYDPKLKYSRKKILNDENIDVITADINDKKKLKELITKNDITHFIHLAAQAGVRYSITNPEMYLKSNINGFVSVLEVIKNYPKIKFIFASSSSVYGNNTKTPFSINDKTDNQVNLYGATKKANESIAYAYHHLYKISMIGLRFFTVYGPWGRPDMAYFKFTKNILEKKPIDIFNQGQMQRDFTYIDDIIEGISKTLDYKTNYEIFNLGNNNPIKLMEFISIIEKKLQMPAIKNFLINQKGEMLTTYADIEHSKNKLNYSPKTSIYNGMIKFIDWYLTEQVN